MKIELYEEHRTATHAFRITDGPRLLWAGRGFATHAYRARAVDIACAALRDDPPTINPALLTPTCAAILREYVKRHWKD